MRWATCVAVIAALRDANATAQSHCDALDARGAAEHPGHARQAGWSVVEPDRLRFDFSHYAAVDAAELADIEQQVNEHIRSNAEVATELPRSMMRWPRGRWRFSATATRSRTCAW